MSNTLTAPVHLAAGKNGSKLVHVIADRSAVCATNGTIIAGEDLADCEGESPFSASAAFTVRPFKLAFAAAEDGAVDIRASASSLLLRSGDDVTASDIARERGVDLTPAIDALRATVENPVEVWIDAAQLAKLARALGTRKGEHVKLTIPTTRGKGHGLIRVTRDDDLRLIVGGIMAAEEVVDANTGESAVKKHAVPMGVVEGEQ